jgi:micrococcal nuclease
MSLLPHLSKLSMVARLVLACFALLLFPYSSITDFTGTVVSVLDGDTLEVLNGHHPERIRLSGIEYPEKGQAFGKRPKQAASALAFGKEVAVQSYGHDKCKRILGDLNQELVKQGWWWWYRKYAPGDMVLEGLEKEPREAKKSLCADPHPVPPLERRKIYTLNHCCPREPRPGRSPLDLMRVSNGLRQVFKFVTPKWF